MSVRVSSADRGWRKAVAGVRSVFFTAVYAERVERVGGEGAGWQGLTPRGSGRGRPDRPRQVAEEDGVGRACLPAPRGVLNAHLAPQWTAPTRAPSSCSRVVMRAGRMSRL